MIYQWKNEGVSNKECAHRLRRHTSTIGRELKRNSYQGKWETFYEPLHAQTVTEDRKKRAWKKKHPLKNKKVFQYTIKRLIRGWSPEQIAGRLKEQHPNDPSWHICHETIYQYIYHKDQKGRAWWEYLRRGHRRRRKKGGRRVQRERIPDRVSIHERPKQINARIEFGHWEGDTVVGKGNNHGLHTAYERLSSYYCLEPMEDLTSKSSIKAQLKIYSSLPGHARRSSTLDNGLEHVTHTRLNKELGMDTYFTDPYSAWQRGGNENGNLWLS